jgi:hypothetical protein
VALAKALYSASVFDRETMGYFLALQEIKFGPRKTTKPPVDRLSSTHQAQLASEKALTTIELDGRILSPMLSVPLTYQRMHLTALKCTVVGECKYWHTLFIAYEMSGLVKVRYCNAVTPKNSKL